MQAGNSGKPSLLSRLSGPHGRKSRKTRLPAPKKRTPRWRKEWEPEELLAYQRKLIFRLILALVVSILLLVAAAAFLIWMFKIINIVDIPDLGLPMTAAANWQCFT